MKQSEKRGLGGESARLGVPGVWGPRGYPELSRVVSKLLLALVQHSTEHKNAKQFITVE